MSESFCEGCIYVFAIVEELPSGCSLHISQIDEVQDCTSKKDK